MPFQEPLAEAWLQPAETYSVRSGPGRRLNFLYGHATLYTVQDVEYVLSLAHAAIEPTNRAGAQVADLIEARDPVLHPALASVVVGGERLSGAAFLRLHRTPVEGEERAPLPPSTPANKLAQLARKAGTAPEE